MGVRLVERDSVIFKEIGRWRAVLSRHIKHLAGFEGQRATDRRLRILLDSGYLERQKILYGVPSILRLAHKAKQYIGANKRKEKIRVDQIRHDVSVIDTVIYFHISRGISYDDILSDKELHQRDGFGERKHHPDFEFKENESISCVEVELSEKSRIRLENNIRSNFIKYDKQYWIVPRGLHKVLRILNESVTTYMHNLVQSGQKCRNIRAVNFATSGQR